MEKKPHALFPCHLYNPLQQNTLVSLFKNNGANYNATMYNDLLLCRIKCTIIAKRQQV